MERESVDCVDKLKVTKRTRMRDFICRTFFKMREPYYRYKNRRLAESAAKNLPQSDFYVEAVRALGLTDDNSYPIKCIYETSGPSAKILKFTIGEEIQDPQLVLYMSQKPLSEYNDTNWVNRVYESMSKLYQARQMRLNDQGKQFFNVPKPLSCGTIQIGRGDKEFGCIAMQNLSSPAPTFFALDGSGARGVMRIDKNETTSTQFNPESYQTDLEDIATAHALTYRLLDRQFPERPFLATGNYLTDRNGQAGLTVSVTDVGAEMRFFESDSKWVEHMGQLEDAFMSRERLGTGKHCRLRPYETVDLEAVLRRADSYLAEQMD